eukprot:CAMPEP_0171132256 /NCGR_PEP_ID=MMETSP0766_2-20121228/124208_1 /TAXON_ID=439317 /ORGANISM="Gambierdiscus australes, Strain CAWD 149" /LENGTH=52 /DNA_ID=CAMNT_0011595585 /DNA_START=1 /DNA_END=156 /DNA_ORIENTATION=+
MEPWWSRSADYTEEQWKDWAAQKVMENPDMEYSEEQWIEYLKEQEEWRMWRR